MNSMIFFSAFYAFPSNFMTAPLFFEGVAYYVFTSLINLFDFIDWNLVWFGRGWRGLHKFVYTHTHTHTQQAWLYFVCDHVNWCMQNKQDISRYCSKVGLPQSIDQHSRPAEVLYIAFLKLLEPFFLFIKMNVKLCLPLNRITCLVSLEVCSFK